MICPYGGGRGLGQIMICPYPPLPREEIGDWSVSIDAEVIPDQRHLILGNLVGRHGVGL